MAALSRKLKYSRTGVYAPFSIRVTPCIVEHLNFIGSGVKSRSQAGNLIWDFKTTFNYCLTLQNSTLQAKQAKTTLGAVSIVLNL
jgi:hypothetical protein